MITKDNMLCSLQSLLIEYYQRLSQKIKSKGWRFGDFCSNSRETTKNSNKSTLRERHRSESCSSIFDSQGNNILSSIKNILKNLLVNLSSYKHLL